MDFVKLLHSVEELVFLIASWLVLVPKTFFRVLFSAEWTYKYIQTQLAIEKPEDRYNDYSPPILFWVGGGILPYITVLNHYVKPPTPNSHNFQNLPLEVQLLIAIFFFIGLPIGFSFVQNLFQGNSLSRTSLQPMFLTQCYCMTFVHAFLRSRSYFWHRWCEAVTLCRTALGVDCDYWFGLVSAN
jgi:hypothetical protein